MGPIIESSQEEERRREEKEKKGREGNQSPKSANPQEGPVVADSQETKRN